MASSITTEEFHGIICARLAAMGAEEASLYVPMRIAGECPVLAQPSVPNQLDFGKKTKPLTKLTRESLFLPATEMRSNHESGLYTFPHHLSQGR
jgi:hypothetical protein